MLSRDQLAGAIKAINHLKRTTPVGHPARVVALRAILVKEFPREKDVDRVIADLDSYPEWVAGKDLDTEPKAGASALPVRPRKAKPAKGAK